RVRRRLAAEVERDEEAAVAVLAHPGEQVAGRAQRREGADVKRRLGAAQRQQAAVEREQRAWVALRRNADRRHVIGERQPGLAGREARAAAAVPLHRRALGITAETETLHVLLERVAHALGGDRHVAHADLVAVVERRRAAE